MEVVFCLVIFSTLGLTYTINGRRNEIYHLFATIPGGKLRDIIKIYAMAIGSSTTSTHINSDSAAKNLRILDKSKTARTDI
jgi:hypothetical protein